MNVLKEAAAAGYSLFKRVFGLAAMLVCAVAYCLAPSYAFAQAAIPDPGFDILEWIPLVSAEYALMLTAVLGISFALMVVGAGVYLIRRLVTPKRI